MKRSDTEKVTSLKCARCRNGEIKARAVFVEKIARAEGWEFEYVAKPKHWRSAQPWKSVRHYCPSCVEMWALEKTDLDAYCERWLTA